MDAGTFRIEIEDVIGKTLSKDLNLLRYSKRGIDFRTKDFRYLVEMKVRKIEKNNYNTHFSIEKSQYEEFVRNSQQAFWQKQKGELISCKPDLLFLFLKYRFPIPSSEVNLWSQEKKMERVLKQSLSLDPGGYLVDHEFLEKYVNDSKWMNVKTTDLNQIIKEKSIEPVTITDLSIPIFSIGENSEELVKRWS
jgi:hypothetical protein